MKTDATIARLRSKIESRDLSPDELYKALLILMEWYGDQLEDKQSAPEDKDLSE